MPWTGARSLWQHCRRSWRRCGHGNRSGIQLSVAWTRYQRIP
ncbi:uncharacterized protein [Drosophila kikkawai]|uniref:Uncharacterized protein n=1 Tax=Drosophila kikkawai TaxID=30033 RepID=A0ABM3C6G8_DROKI|nr:uncharacterized protein LOC121502423 [Drosophila kikkawai]